MGQIRFLPKELKYWFLVVYYRALDKLIHKKDLMSSAGRGPVWLFIQTDPFMGRSAGPQQTKD